jgi:DNA polymerase-4
MSEREKSWPGPVIAHLDMDSFFASVEILDDPSLKGKPLVVGGSGARGVVASCSYEARVFGVHSAMPSARARQLCPHLIFLDGRYGRYSEVSAQLHEVLETITPDIEPIGLDEAFLDIAGAQALFGSPKQIAQLARSRVYDALGLSAGVGVGTSKMIAKLASKSAKPRVEGRSVRPGPGVVVIEPGDEIAFLHPMAVERLWGVGPATKKRLHELGVRTVAQLSAIPVETLVRALGRAQGEHLSALAHGIDNDRVVSNREMKSLGHEETFARDITDRDEIARQLLRMSESVAVQLRSKGVAARTLTLKVKYADFTGLARSATQDVALDTGAGIAEVVIGLSRSVEIGVGIRLLGVSASGFLSAKSERQLSFSLDDGSDDVGHAALRRQDTWEAVTPTLDEIRDRFGINAVGTAAMVKKDEGVKVPSRRQAPWGPKAQEQTQGEDSLS